MWRRAAASRSGPSSALRPKSYDRPATRPASRRSRRRRSSRGAHRGSASKSAACTSEAALAGISRPLQNKTAAALRKAASETCVLIALANRAIHQKCVRGGCLPERTRRRAFCSLRRFALLALPARLIARLITRLIIEDHLLETAAPPAGTSTAAIRRDPGLCCGVSLPSLGWASCGRASAAWKLSAAQSTCAARLPWSLRPRSLRPRSLRVVAPAASVCSWISWRSCVCGSLAGTLGRGRRSFDGFKRRNRERHIDRARLAPQIELLRRVIKSQLADLNSVVPKRQSRQIEMAGFVRPTHPGAPGAGFDETKVRAGNRHATCRVNQSRSFG